MCLIIILISDDDWLRAKRAGNETGQSVHDRLCPRRDSILRLHGEQHLSRHQRPTQPTQEENQF